MRKKSNSALLVFYAGFCMAQYPSQNIVLLGHWDDATAQTRDSIGTQYSSVYGYYDATRQKEYAIVGGSAGTYFIEVTDPANPVVRDFVAGKRDSCTWREFRTYGKYAYMVSDDLAPNSLQIADLSYLPDSAHLVYDDDTLFERAHTVFVDGDKIYFGITTKGTELNTMSVYSLGDPESPVLLGKLDNDFPPPEIEPVHDMFVRNDTVYASAGYQGLFILKFNSDSTFSLLASLSSYPGQGYNHSSALTPDGHTLIFTNEDPVGLPVKVLDVSDLSDLTILSDIKSNEGATAHNPYIFGKDKVIISYYQDGIQVFDISDPANPVRTGYFDTRPENGENNGYPEPPYQGCWGAYPYLPSGNLLAIDMQNGLFVLNPAVAVGPVSINEIKEKENIRVYPNPFKDEVRIDLSLKKRGNYSFKIVTITGEVVSFGTKELPAGVSSIFPGVRTVAPGNYILEIEGEDFSYRQKVTKGG